MSLCWDIARSKIVDLGDDCKLEQINKELKKVAQTLTEEQINELFDDEKVKAVYKKWHPDESEDYEDIPHNNDEFEIYLVDWREGFGREFYAMLLNGQDDQYDVGRIPFQT